MLISVITVCRNAETTIEKTIKSVLQQKYNEFEYIVVDGASTDNTFSIINRYLRDVENGLYPGKRMIFSSEPDQGIYDAMNKGIAKANNQYLLFLNSGDTLYDNKVLFHIAKEIEQKNIKSDIILGNVIVEKEGKQFVSKHIDNISDIWYRIPACHQASFYRKQTLQDLGGYDIGYHIIADYVLDINIIMSGGSYSFIDEIVAYYDGGGISSIATDVMLKEHILFLIDILKNEKFFRQKDKFFLNCDINRVLDYWKNNLYDSVLYAAINSNKKNIISCKKCVIWGTGTWGKRISDYCDKNSINIDFFVDSNINKLDNNVRSIECLKEYSGYVVIAILRSDEVIKDIMLSYSYCNPSIYWITLEELAKELLITDGSFVEQKNMIKELTSLYI